MVSRIGLQQITERSVIRLAFFMAGIFLFLTSCNNGGGGVQGESSLNGEGGTAETASLFIGEIQQIDRSGTPRMVLNGVVLSVPAGTPMEFERGRETGTFDDLREGMVVRVEGVLLDGRTTGRATRIQFEDLLEGPVASVETIRSISSIAGMDVAKVVQIMGQKVLVDRGVTRFDERDPSFNYDTLSPGQVVEVDGFLRGDFAIVATFIRKKADNLESFLAAGDDLEIKNVLSTLLGTFGTMGELFVDLSDAAIQGDLAGLSRLVEVRAGRYDPATNTLFATDIQVLPIGPGVENIEHARIEGVSRGPSGGRRFALGFMEVDAGNAHHVGLDGSNEGVRGEAIGSVVDGIFVAERVIPKDDIFIAAPIAPIGQLSYLGFQVGFHPDRTMDFFVSGTHRIIQARMIGFDQQGVPNIMAVHNRPFQEEDLDDLPFGGLEKLRIQGRVMAVDNGVISILGFLADTSTILDGNFKAGETPIGRQAFLASLEAGDLVLAIGRFEICSDFFTALNFCGLPQIQYTWEEIRVFE